MANYDYALEKSKIRLEESHFIKLIYEQAEWVKKRQNDFSYSLDYNSYKAERDANKLYGERFKKLSEFKSDFEAGIKK